MTTLNDNELRVLGVLIEKSLTQAGSYPLTMNAITLGANQKQNRNPVTSLSEGDVARALGTLDVKELVAQAPPAPGARSNKFRHRVVEVYKWDKRDQAIMAELMLRGRQTAGELRTHASRMASFNELASVLSTLQSLAQREERFVEELPREPGRSANRWRHRLGGSDTADVAAMPTTAPESAAVPSASAPATAARPPLSGTAPSLEIESLLLEVNALRHKVERLEERLTVLESRV